MIVIAYVCIYLHICYKLLLLIKIWMANGGGLTGANIFLLYFCEKTFNLFFFNHDNTMNTKNNKNYIQVRRSPSDDYKH